MTDATTVQPLYDTYNRAALRFERGEGHLAYYRKR